MSLQKQIDQDLTSALKDGDKVVVSVLRMLKTSLQNKMIEKKLGKEDGLPDEEVVAAIKSEVKKRQDSITSYKEGKRDDLVEAEQAEMAVLDKYMPEQMSDDQVKEIINQIITETGASSQADFGKVMGAAMNKMKGQVDGQVVSQAVKDLLAQD